MNKRLIYFCIERETRKNLTGIRSKKGKSDIFISLRYYYYVTVLQNRRRKSMGRGEICTTLQETNTFLGVAAAAASYATAHPGITEYV
jgi:hypothetical protein